MTELVDSHSHVLPRDCLPDAFWESMVDAIGHQLEREGNPTDERTIRSEYLPTLWDPNGEVLLSSMDAAGLNHRIVFPLDHGVQFEEPPVDIRAYNRSIRDLQRDHPDRLSGFVSIDPRRDEATEVVETALSEWDLRGLKLQPLAGFHPNDKACYDLVDIARDRDKPVLIHTGPGSNGLCSECAHPRHLADLLEEFSDVDVVAAHMSLSWWEEMLVVAEEVPDANLHVDLSGWQSQAGSGERLDGFAGIVRQFVDILGPDRVLFGTDFPMFERICPTDEWVTAVASFRDRETEPTFTERELDKILSKNARSLLN